ncbi:MAG: lytic murein transglycosylase B [Gammaproteobacteria bacterium]
MKNSLQSQYSQGGVINNSRFSVLNNKQRTILVILFALCLLPLTILKAAVPTSAAIDHFVDNMAQKHGLKPAEVNAILAKAQYQPQIIESITRPYEKQPWYRYRQHFLKPERIEQGAIFLQQHHASLMRAEKEYGVPASLITAIIGVETAYGHYLGGYRVLDSLYTLSFYYPPRSAFFQSELEQFLLLARENQLDPIAPVGSYAGAIGQPQFMPSSYRQYAVDYNHDGKKDLSGNVEDSVGSIANYFKQKGWHRNETIVVPATVQGNQFLSLPGDVIKLQYTVNDLNTYGIKAKTHLPLDEKVIWLRLAKNATMDEYWLGRHNFYVITHYNHSINYAMAVYELSEAIQKAYEKKVHAT